MASSSSLSPRPRYDTLVTGASGHLGAALMLSLPSMGYTPLGLDILASSTCQLIGDIADRSFLQTTLDAHNHIENVIHCATLHKPHVDSHTKSDFVDTNITGTLNLLETAAALHDEQGIKRIRSFIFISTTSTFGAALSPKPGSPAAWIDESAIPIPKNIYGVTKVAAEDLCSLIHRQTGMPVLILRTSRFFPEQDDDSDRRSAMEDANLKVCELAYRRADIEDIVRAVVCAMQRAKSIGFDRYIISAPPPFARPAHTSREGLLQQLDHDAASALAEAVPASRAVFEKLGWRFLPRIDRVYDSAKAVRELGWKPEWTFEKVVARLADGQAWCSVLTGQVGMRGYHAVPTGVYTLETRKGV